MEAITPGLAAFIACAACVGFLSVNRWLERRAIERSYKLWMADWIDRQRRMFEAIERVEAATRAGNSEE